MSRILLQRTLAVFLVAGALLAVGAAAQGPFDGHWQGSITLPNGKLEIDVDLETGADGALTGDISIPVQGIRDLGLTDVAAEGRDVRFAIPGIPGDPRFEGQLAEGGKAINGTFRQGGAELAFELVRGDDSATLARRALEGFDAVVDTAVASFNVPGLAIGVVAGGEVVYAQGFGLRDREGGLPVTPDTLFAIGSTTKAMTATVLGMLVDEGKVAWDEPVQRYLPSFRLADPEISTRVTLRDMLTHRTGLPRHDLAWYNLNDISRAEMVARIAHMELSADLREKWQYNNLMFLTAGFLAGRLTGKTWEEVVRERLFAPLGMDRTNFSIDDAQADSDHALPYRENDDEELERIPFRRIDLAGPAGSVNSSVNEMNRWLLFNLSGGKVGERQLVQPTTLADIQSPHMTIDTPPTRPDISQASYGMGWVIDTYRGHRRVHHGGGIDGFVTEVALFPDDDLGLVVFVNRGSSLPDLVVRTAADRILGLDAEDWLGDALAKSKQAKAVAKEAEAKKEAIRVQGTTPSHPLADYVGRYENPGYGVLEIAAAEPAAAAASGEAAGESGGENPAANALTLTLNGITAPLEHWHYDVWSGAETDGDKTFENLKFLFRTNVDGQIDEVESSLEISVGPIVFTKKPDTRLFDPAYLARFVGRYSLPPQVAEVTLSGNVLSVTLPGQPTYTLEPDVSGRFVLKEVKVVSVGFEADAEGKVVKLIFYQPGATFEATRVEE